MKTKGKMRINKGKLTVTILLLCMLVALANVVVSFAMYPEQYLPTWKKCLANDLANGNQEMMEYYNSRYVANGKYLFGDRYIIEEDCLNLATVVDFATTESGLMLYTNDGNRYYIAR